MSEETSPTNKVLRNNLVGLLIAGVAAASLASVTEGTTVIFFGIGFLVQAGINGLIGLVNAIQGKPAAGYLLSCVLVLLIGFGACTGMLALNLVKLGSMH